MSFLNQKTYAKCTTKKRKENDSCLAHHFNYKFHLSRERASAFTSRGTITLEATIVTAFFFFGTLCLVAIFEITVTRTAVKSALHAVAKEVAVDVCVIPEIPVSKMEKRLVEILGEEELERSLVVGGCQGFDCSSSKKSWNTTIMELSVQYRMEIPILMFRIPLIQNKETIRVKGWTGYEERRTDSGDIVMAYVTDYGEVYHMDKSCAFLDLSVRVCTKEEAERARSQNGAKYKECSYCKYLGDSARNVYITDYGEKYHFSLECKGLKRTIYTMPLLDVKEMGGCSKCVE